MGAAINIHSHRYNIKRPEETRNKITVQLEKGRNECNRVKTLKPWLSF